MKAVARTPASYLAAACIWLQAIAPTGTAEKLVFVRVGGNPGLSDLDAVAHRYCECYVRDGDGGKPKWAYRYTPERGKRLRGLARSEAMLVPILLNPSGAERYWRFTTNEGRYSAEAHRRCQIQCGPKALPLPKGAVINPRPAW